MSTDAARSPKSGQKLSFEERRTAILRAVRRVFAEKGFDGTTTRELADAAGVSEALLFKHFPNKEALFSAMKLSLNEQDLGRLERIKELEPSVSTLVLLVHFLTHLLIEGWTTEQAVAELRANHWTESRNPKMLPYLNEHVGELAAGLVASGVLQKAPDPLPQFEP